MPLQLLLGSDAAHTRPWNRFMLFQRISPRKWTQSKSKIHNDTIKYFRFNFIAATVNTHLIGLMVVALHFIFLQKLIRFSSVTFSFVRRMSRRKIRFKWPDNWSNVRLSVCECVRVHRLRTHLLIHKRVGYCL